MMTYLNVFCFGIYPYIALTVFFLGSLIRYDYSPYSWRADSSQLLSKRGMGFGSNLFHIGIIGIFLGHLVGLLTPHSVYEYVITPYQKQRLAMIAGGICGILVLSGGSFLMFRRLFNPRIRKTSSFSDFFIIILFVFQVCLGLYSIMISSRHPDGAIMLQLSKWAQDIVYLRGAFSDTLINVPFIYKIHIVTGLTFFLIFPFTRLVHIWSIPISYLVRRYQIVRLRR